MKLFTKREIFNPSGIRRQHHIKLPDAIIAATALNLNLPILIRNVKNFKAISGIEIINPFDSKAIF
ncbi:hypothetical protein GMMP15_1080005 [Candidatus Magnetomoraceae bacterium gMMP-15]